MAEILIGEGGIHRPLGRTVVTIGVFDGVHLGHQRVVASLERLKRSIGADRSVLVTFDRHPLGVTHPGAAPPLLTTLDEKLSILRTLDVDVIRVEPFTEETARIEYRDFIARRLVGDLGMVHLVIGYDFHLGRGRRGSQELLVGEGRSAGFGVTVVPPVVARGSVISSSKIRRAVAERKLEGAARSLGRSYFFDADVVQGEGIGRRLDFPTANVSVPCRDKLVPPGGVYAVEAEVEGRRRGGMMNIGEAPTLRSGGGGRIEVHLFDFSGDLYGARLRIHCLRFLRRERKFADADELRAQLRRDREKALAALEKKD